MPPAHHPDDLGPALLAALNAGDLDSVVSCYDPQATLELPDGTTAEGIEQIREYFSGLLASRPTFAPGQAAPALIRGDVALTTTKIGNTATAEVAQRQDDGTWRWILDRPNVMLERP